MYVCIYIRASKKLFGKYYQANKNDYKRKLAKHFKDINIFLKKKTNSDNMILNVTKLSQKMKIKSFLNIEKNLIERQKTLYHNDKKVF